MSQEKKIAANPHPAATDLASPGDPEARSAATRTELHTKPTTRSRSTLQSGSADVCGGSASSDPPQRELPTECR